jgi:hypothetical protein
MDPSHQIVSRAATPKSERCPSCNGWGALRVRWGATNHRSIPHGKVVQMLEDDLRYVGTRPWCVCTHCGGTGRVVEAVSRRLEGITELPAVLVVVRRHRNHRLRCVNVR